MVADLPVLAGFCLARQERGWLAAGIGGGLWFVPVVAVVLVMTFVPVDMHQEEIHEFLAHAYLVTACAAYALAALCTGSRRTA